MDHDKNQMMLLKITLKIFNIAQKQSNMNTTRIISIAALIVSIVLAVLLYKSIFNSIDEAERIEKIESKVINKLMMIRDAQKAYQAVNGQYTSDWDKLLNFAVVSNIFLFPVSGCSYICS